MIRRYINAIIINYYYYLFLYHRSYSRLGRLAEVDAPPPVQGSPSHHHRPSDRPHPRPAPTSTTSGTHESQKAAPPKAGGAPPSDRPGKNDLRPPAHDREVAESEG